MNRRLFLRDSAIIVAGALVAGEALDRLLWEPKRLWAGFGDITRTATSADVKTLAELYRKLQRDMVTALKYSTPEAEWLARVPTRAIAKGLAVESRVPLIVDHRCPPNTIIWGRA